MTETSGNGCSAGGRSAARERWPGGPLLLPERDELARRHNLPLRRQRRQAVQYPLQRRAVL